MKIVEKMAIEEKLNILKQMRFVQNIMNENRHEVALYKEAPKFVPAGQSTQMIIGATQETDFQ